MALVQHATNKFLDGEAEQRAGVERQAVDLYAVESDLAAHVRRAWERNRDHKRRHVEPRLFACLRQRSGEYDPETYGAIKATGGSEIFMMLTATKVRACIAWIRDILLPAGDRAWGLDPTPVPEIPRPIAAEIQQRVVMEVQRELMAQRARAEQQGQEMPAPDMAQLRATIAQRVEQRRDDVKQAAQDHAREAAERMTERIADQFAEGRYEAALEECIDDFATFPAMILKGPVKHHRPTLKWRRGWQPVQAIEVRDECERVSPFDIYPSPDAVHINDGELCEHVRFRRGDLYEAIDLEGWSEEALREVLREHGEGGLHLWLWDESERARLEGRDSWEHDAERIDGVHFWGRAQGVVLLRWGVSAAEIDDPLADYEIEAILIGRHVVRAVVNDDPLLRRPYHKASYEAVPGSWWGVGLPELMADIQRMCNATARALANNMALASGPIVEVYQDRLADGESASNLHPWRIFQTKSDPMGGSNNRAISFYQPSSNARALMSVYEFFERKADDATSIPRYSYGNERVGGAGQTASGLSMLMESASKGIRAAVGHIDQGVIRPLVSQFYYHNMIYAEDRAIKGDLKPVARGAAALVAKDSAQARRMEMLNLITNEIGLRVVGVDGYAEILREIVNGADLPDTIVPSREELKAQLAAEREQPGPEAQEATRKARELKMDAAERDRRFELDREKLALEAEDVRHDNALEARRFAAEHQGLIGEAMRPDAPTR